MFRSRTREPTLVLSRYLRGHFDYVSLVRLRDELVIRRYKVQGVWNTCSAGCRMMTLDSSLPARVTSPNDRAFRDFDRYLGIPRIEFESWGRTYAKQSGKRANRITLVPFIAGNERCLNFHNRLCLSIVKATQVSDSCTWKMIPTCYVINVVTSYVAVCHDSIVFHVERVFARVCNLRCLSRLIATSNNYRSSCNHRVASWYFLKSRRFYF